MSPRASVYGCPGNTAVKINPSSQFTSGAIKIKCLIFLKLHLFDAAPLIMTWYSKRSRLVLIFWFWTQWRKCTPTTQNGSQLIVLKQITRMSAIVSPYTHVRGWSRRSVTFCFVQYFYFYLYEASRSFLGYCSCNPQYKFIQCTGTYCFDSSTRLNIYKATDKNTLN